MKIRIVSLVAAVLFAGAAFAADAPAAPVTLQAKNGNVTFNHKTHAAVKCETCHATAAGGKIEGFGKDKAHALCVECHKKEAKGPAKCAECHKKA
ncbi:cytochrome c3 family protein [Anaeromyxobacter terrae]|uniref:cytochrome c3 family protein n=1 Tax=Anaeromyxobacter terrae TaxID=2925406 RepID=UPI001F56F0E5|nr:cytochrome c3 family protein [Anaeromyxobacter sp. SG22]